MGVNWSAGLMRWQPHMDKDGRSHPLNHLHPFRFDVVLPVTEKQAEITVCVHVGFGLHCFTKKVEPDDSYGDLYEDMREQRTFCYERYELSKKLRAIIESLQQRRCGFAKADNFVSIDVSDQDGATVRYGVFFNVKKWKEMGDNAVLIVVQSAYRLDPDKPDPSRGRIGLNVLLGHALRGTRPRPAR